MNRYFAVFLILVSFVICQGVRIEQDGKGEVNFNQTPDSSPELLMPSHHHNKTTSTSTTTTVITTTVNNTTPSTVTTSSTTSMTTSSSTSTSTTPSSTTTLSTTPSSTTEKSTTFSPNTTTMPSTTTTQQPITTTSKPAPEIATWVVKNDNGTCVIVKMAAQLRLTYTGEDNKTIPDETIIPKSANATGSCGNTSDVITLSFVKDNKKYNVTLKFSKNDTLKEFAMSELIVKIQGNTPLPPKNVTELSFHMTKPEFNTPLSRSYHCAKLQKITLVNNVTNDTVYDAVFQISNVQFEAFHGKKDDVFSSAQDCETQGTEVVPIAVGCALAALIIVVIIAYIVGRHRSQARGYLSM